MSDDAYSEWLLRQVLLYIERAKEPSLSETALMYFAGMRDGLARANIRYHEEGLARVRIHYHEEKQR